MAPVAPVSPVAPVGPVSPVAPVAPVSPIEPVISAVIVSLPVLPEPSVTSTVTSSPSINGRVKSISTLPSLVTFPSPITLPFWSLMTTLPSSFDSTLIVSGSFWVASMTGGVVSRIGEVVLFAG